MDNEPTTTLHETLDQVTDINEGSELLVVLNFPAPSDGGSFQPQLLYKAGWRFIIILFQEKTHRLTVIKKMMARLMLPIMAKGNICIFHQSSPHSA